MNRRNFFRTAPTMAATLVGVTAVASNKAPAGVHLSLDPESPFYAGRHCRAVKRVLFNGEEISKCSEASEPDGFVVQNVHARAGNLHLLREPGAVFIPATDRLPMRVKRFGVVRIEFREKVS